MVLELGVFRLESRLRQKANVRFKSLAISQIWKGEDKNSPKLFSLMSLAETSNILLDVINTITTCKGKTLSLDTN